MRATHTLFLLGLVGGVLFGIPAVAHADDLTPLQGTWLFESVTEVRTSGLGRVWHSVVEVRGTSFTLTKFMGSGNAMTGQVTLTPSAKGPSPLDLAVQELDLSDTGRPVRIPATKVRGICRLADDRLTVCFTLNADAPRPTTFDSPGDDLVQFTLKKAPTGFKALPTKVVVRVVGADGQPSPGAAVAVSAAREASGEWKLTEVGRAGGDRSAEVDYARLWFNPLIARDAAGRAMAVVPVSPASLAGGRAEAKLQPLCRVTGRLDAPDEDKVRFFLDLDRRPAFNGIASGGTYDLLLPPGRYNVRLRGTDGGRADATIAVPAGRQAFGVDTIRLTPGAMARLRGKAAPALDGISAWKGKEVKLADLKGRHVLLDFWGHWCAPCVKQMPVLFELHEKYDGKGLAVVCVHVDSDGEVDAAAKLDDKLATVRKAAWAGKDLPFPVALVRGGRPSAESGPVQRYGVTRFPTTILIDPAGNVVGEFPLGDGQTAVAEVEKLLKQPK